MTDTDWIATSPAGRTLVALALIAHFAEEAEWDRSERRRGQLVWLRSDGTRR